MKTPSILIPIAVLVAALLVVTFAWENRSEAQRNFVLISRVHLLMDSSYDRAPELQALQLSGANWQAGLATVSSVCDGKVINAPKCTRALMASVDAGLALGDLAPYLETLTNYPAEQSIIASYAGEIWYRLGAVDDAVTVWRGWLTPLHRIDKASRLYDAGHTDTALLLVDSLDPEARIKSGVRRGVLTRILVQVAQESAKNQDYVTAETYWRRAAVQYPERAGYHFNLAIALQRQDRFEEALTPLQEAVRLQPDSVSYQLRLARALERLGRREEAKEAVQRVLALDPENQAAKRLLEQTEQQ